MWRCVEYSESALKVEGAEGMGPGRGVGEWRAEPIKIHFSTREMHL